MVVIVETLDGCVLDCAVHALDLAIRPGVLWFGRAVLDAERGAGILEGVRPEGFALGQGLGDQWCRRSTRAQCREMGPVIGQHDGHPVRHGLDKMPQKVGGRFAQGFAMKLDEAKFARSINGY